MVATFPVAEYVELPTWSVEPQRLLFRTEAEVHCSDASEIVEISVRIGEVGWDRGLQVTEDIFQAQQCTGWDGKMAEENGMRLFRDDAELPQVGEGYHFFNDGTIGVRNRMVEFNVTEARGGLEEVKELSQKDTIPGDPTKAECREVQQTPPGQLREDPTKT